MAVPGAGHNEVGVRHCGERGDVAGLRRARGSRVGCCFGGRFGGCGRRGKAVGVVDSMDGLFLMYGPEADIAICVVFSVRLNEEGEER